MRSVTLCGVSRSPAAARGWRRPPDARRLSATTDTTGRTGGSRSAAPRRPRTSERGGALSPRLPSAGSATLRARMDGQEAHGLSSRVLLPYTYLLSRWASAPPLRPGQGPEASQPQASADLPAPQERARVRFRVSLDGAAQSGSSRTRGWGAAAGPSRVSRILGEAEFPVNALCLCVLLRTNDVRLLQTQLCPREGHEASRVGLYTLPRDQHMAGRQGARETGFERGPDSMHRLREVTDERQHHEHGLHQ